MKIGIDARSLLASNPRGEGRSLLRLYQEIASIRPNWTFRFFGETVGTIPNLKIRNGEISVLQMPGFRFNLWENLALPFRAWRSGMDLLHCSSSTAPHWSPVPIVLTIHDVIPLVFDDGWPQQAIERFRRQLGYGLKAARAVIAVSHHTKKDLVRLFDIDPAKIHVVHWGVDSPTHSGDPGALQRHGLTGRYVMAFGGDARRKNTEGVMKAFARAALPNIQLVLVGLGRGVARARFEEMAQELGIGSRVRMLEYVTDADLEAVLCSAECLLYPSLYEGFGLPVLEAMSRGVPLVASDTTSIPEVAGSAALLVNPESTEEIADALIRISSDAALRNQLTEQGRRRAEQFTWHRAASETVRLFELARDCC